MTDYTTWTTESLRAKARDLQREYDRAQYDHRNPDAWTRLQALEGEIGRITAEIVKRTK